MKHTIERGAKGAKDGRINVRLPQEQEGWLKRLAGKRHVTVGVIVREMIEVRFAKRHAK
jgi:predicted DNA-binding protein